MTEKMKPSGIDWIGEIPNEWGITKVRFVTKLRSEQGFYSPDDKYIGLENISSYTGKYIPTASEYDAGTYDLYKAGDLLFSKLRPYLAKALIADDCGFCTGELAVIKEYNGDIRYLFYYMLSDGFLKMVDVSTYGAKMPRASWDYIKNLQIPVMRKSEQQAIADFLDKECAQIDSIAADLEKQITLLQQYKKSLITEMTTPDDSCNWTKTKIKYIGEIRGRIGFRGYTVEDTVDPGTPGCAVVLGGTNIMKDGTTDYENLTFLSENKYFESPEIMLYGGEILITKVGAGTGENSVYDGRFERATTNPNVMILTPKKSVNSQYINYLLLSKPIKEDMKVESTKSGAQPAINQGYVNNIVIYIPTLERQDYIVGYLDTMCAEIDDTIRIKNEQLKLITQHKKSLIYEYVTGKKRVKEVR